MTRCGFFITALSFVFFIIISEVKCSTLPNAVLDFGRTKIFGTDSSDAASVEVLFGTEGQTLPVFYPVDNDQATGCKSAFLLSPPSFVNIPEASSDFALYFERGTCSFAEKIQTAHSLGALAVIVGNQEESIYNETSGRLMNACSVDCELSNSQDINVCERSSKCPSHYCLPAFLSSDQNSGAFCCVVEGLLDMKNANQTRNMSAIFLSVEDAVVFSEAIISSKTQLDPVNYFSMELTISERKRFKVDPSVVLLLLMGTLAVSFASFRAVHNERIDISWIWGSKYTRFVGVDKVNQYNAEVKERNRLRRERRKQRLEQEALETAQQEAEVNNKAKPPTQSPVETEVRVTTALSVHSQGEDSEPEETSVSSKPIDKKKSRHLSLGDMSLLDGTGGVQHEVMADESLESVELTNIQGLVMIIFACVGIVGLFFAVKKYSTQVVIAIIVIYGIGAVYATSYFLVRPVLRMILPKKFAMHVFHTSKMLHWIIEEKFTLESFIGLLITVALVVVWFLFRHTYKEYIWILQNLFSFGIACMFLATLRANRFQTCVYVLFGFFVYDIFMVFITPFFGGKQSVMLVVATAGQGSESPPSSDGLFCERINSEQMPMLFIAPRFDYRGGYGLLGLGDVLLPGIFLTYVLRVDYIRARMHAMQILIYSDKIPIETRLPSGWSLRTFLKFHFYWLSAVAAYLLALVITFIANLQGWTINGVPGQPALLYLVPFTLITFAIEASCKNERKVLWKTSLEEFNEETLRKMVLVKRYGREFVERQEKFMAKVHKEEMEKKKELEQLESQTKDNNGMVVNVQADI